MMLFNMIEGDRRLSRESEKLKIEDLILKLKEKNTDALEALYNKTKTSVYGLALSILKRPQDAEDITQETYIRIFHGAKDYQRKGKPMAWILRITRNLSFDRLKLKSESELLIESEWIPEKKENFTEESIDRLLLNTVLSQLSLEERQIVILHSLEGFKHREIASLLEIPLATAISKYHRSLSKLKKLLEGEKNERN